MEPNVTAVITAMTDAEQSFLSDTLEAVVRDSCLGQILICVEENNTWINPLLEQFEDDRIEALFLPMMILSAARNHGVREAKYDWIAFCDGDDVWCKNKTRHQLKIAIKEKAHFVGADHYLISEKGITRACALSLYIPMPSSWLVLRKTMLDFPFDESIRQGQDGEWWLRTHQYIKKARCAKRLLKYRVRPSSLSSSRPSKRKKALIVRLGSVELIGKLIFGATYILWLIGRKNEYVWNNRKWGVMPEPLKARY